LKLNTTEISGLKDVRISLIAAIQIRTNPVDFPFHINHSMSQRVMTVPEELTPEVGHYSNEMLLDITGIDGCEDFEHFGRRLRAHVLAKSAQWASEEWCDKKSYNALF
jgi:DNA polymerase V